MEKERERDAILEIDEGHRYGLSGNGSEVDLLQRALCVFTASACMRDEGIIFNGACMYIYIY